MQWRSSLLVILVCSVSAFAQAPVKEAPKKRPLDPLSGPPVVSAKAWAILNAKTGKFINQSNEKTPLPIASTTKVMTAWVVLQLAEKDPKVLDEVLTVTERAAKTPGSSARLQPGDKVTVRELLYGLLLPSGNDAAAAFADYLGNRFATTDDGEKQDNITSFVAEMNRQAESLKLTKTKYLDPHGLGRNLSTVHDLALLARTALTNESFRPYVKTQRYVGKITGMDGTVREAVWENTNQLLGIDGYDGVKTGTTNAAGACLISSGHREDDHLIIVVLGSTSSDGRYVDTRNLFRYGWTELGHKPAGK